MPVAVAGGRVLHPDALVRAADRRNPRPADRSRRPRCRAHRRHLVQRQPQPQAAADRSGHRDPGRLRPDIARAVRLAAHVLRLRDRQPGHRGDGREDLRPHLGPGRAAPAGGRSTAAALRFPASLRLRQHRTVDDRTATTSPRCCPTCPVTWGTRPSNHLLLHPHLARFHGRLRRHHRRNASRCCRRSGSDETRPTTGAPDFFGFARDYLHAYLPTTRGCRRKRSRPTGSAWNASWTTSPTTSTSNAPTSASTTSTGST